MTLNNDNMNDLKQEAKAVEACRKLRDALLHGDSQHTNLNDQILTSSEI